MTPAVHPIRVGFVGCGQATAGSHLPALRFTPEVQVLAVADVDEARAHRVADRFRIPHRYPDVRALLDRSDLDVVAVCVPAIHHADVAVAVLEAGKHLFLEKPIAGTLADADRIRAAAARATGRVLLGFNLRWHRLAQQARATIADGALGRLTLLRAGFTSFHDEIPDWRKKRASAGGVFFEQAVHHFDLWRFLMNAEIDEVSAMSRSGIWDDESAVLTIRFSNGVLGSLALDVHSAPTNEIELFGANGRLRFSFYRFDSFQCAATRIPTDGVGPRVREVSDALKRAPSGALRLRRGGDFIESFQTEWRHFHDVIRRGAPVQCSLDDGRRALQAAIAASQSAAASGRPVRVADVTA